MDGSTPGLPVLHHLPKLVQTSVHWVSDTILQSHPLSSPSTRAFCLFQHQGLFHWVSSLHQMAKVMELQPASVLLMNIHGWFPLVLTGLNSLWSQGLSRIFSNTTVQKHPILWCSAFFMVQLSHPYILLLYWLCQSLWLCGPQQTGKFWKRREYQTTWPACSETCVQVKEATDRTGHGTMVW